MSVVDWVCKKISLESASERLSAIAISRQQVLPSKFDACANVTTCCCDRETEDCVTAGNEETNGREPSAEVCVTETEIGVEDCVRGLEDCVTGGEHCVTGPDDCFSSNEDMLDKT